LSYRRISEITKFDLDINIEEINFLINNR